MQSIANKPANLLVIRKRMKLNILAVTVPLLIAIIHANDNGHSTRLFWIGNDHATQ